MTRWEIGILLIGLIIGFTVGGFMTVLSYEWWSIFPKKMPQPGMGDYAPSRVGVNRGGHNDKPPTYPRPDPPKPQPRIIKIHYIKTGG